jgi:WD40 repeat protein
MKSTLVLLAVCALSLGSPHCSSEQSVKGGGCSIPEPQLRSDKPNIFSEQQEQWAGDAQSGQSEAYYELLPEKDSAELERIGQKLLAQLPPTPIHYHFRVYEAEEANGFSVAGGYVYISRKLITDARSEDEVAGVLSHEIGHIYTHQVAIAYTRELKAMLHVSALGDRQDVEDKLQLLLNAPWKEGADESEDQAEKDELLADRVGMYALIKAGYAPRALAENLDRIAANKGHTGNFLTDALGTTSEISLRVRTARKIASGLPGECGERIPGSSPEFKSFQETIRDAPIHPLIQPTPGLSSIKLEPPMQPALEQVRFSPNGAYILAQDETSIHVLSRSPLKHLFSIDAPGAQLAKFTPDSGHVVFHYHTMRVEKWDISSGKRERFRELVDYEGCEQTNLSPDGNTFVCISRTSSGTWLKLIDVDSGKLILDDKKFYQANFQTQSYRAIERSASTAIASIEYSQDGHIMVLAVGTRVLAYDLVNRKPINVGRELSHLMQGRIAFVDSDKLVFECDWDAKAGAASDTYKICETTFPDGTLINSFKMGYQWMEPVTHGNRVLIGPFRDSAAMLYDPSTSKASAAFKLDSIDLYDQYLASENERGGITAGELGSTKMESLDLPIAPMRRLEAAAFSPDGRFLAYSGRSRSSIWNLDTQARVALMRPFRAARFDDQDQMHAQFEESHQKPGANYRIDLKTGKSAEEAKYAVEQVRYGDVLIAIEPLEKTGDVVRNTNLRVFDPSSGALLWSRHFSHETPVVRGTDGDALLLIVDLTLQTAADETDHAGDKLVKTSDKPSEWIPQGLLVEIVDSRTGEVRRKIVVPQRHVLWSGSDLRMAVLYGDYLVVRGNANNSVIYKVSDGKRMGAFYGRTIAGDSGLGLLAATNRDQEVIIYSAKTGIELKRVTLDQVPRAARFVPSKNALLVLTANQTVYTIDLPVVSAPQEAKRD